MSTSRRHFLRAAAGLSAATSGLLDTPFALSLAGLGAMAAQSSSAADASGGYKALVCLYMAGGNDSHNWVVPTQSSEFASYTAARTDLAWAANRLLPLSGGGQAAGRSFAMPDTLSPLRDWYESGKLAVVPNVGPLDRPITASDYAAGRNLPSKLFSHNDQASTWQSLSPEGALSGWGGRMGDLLMSANRYPVFTAVSAAGNAVFLTGSNVSQYQISSDGPVAIGALNDSFLQGSNTAAGALRRVLQRGGTEPFQAEYTRVMQRSLDTTATLQSAIANTGVPGLPGNAVALPGGGSLTLDGDPLARQLRVVAQMAQAAQALGTQRQVFMVSIGGFDTHANQLRDHSLLMSRVAYSVSWFLHALNNVGMLNNVTLFSASDFGRALTCNGSGSDHGWGSHHIVAGGAVRGRNIYGRFPTVALGSADDVGLGRLLPSTSVNEYAAVMGRWMGLSNSELTTVLPGLSNFSSTNLGFL